MSVDDGVRLSRPIEMTEQFPPELDDGMLGEEEFRPRGELESEREREQRGPEVTAEEGRVAGIVVVGIVGQPDDGIEDDEEELGRCLGRIIFFAAAAAMGG